jgi:prephenate dehydratase
VSKSGDLSIGAVASARAARLYGLSVLVPDIQDHDFNFTRFAVLSREQIVPDDADKISLVFALSHRPGTLYSALKSFADAGVNLTNLESRPIWSQAWHYFFHLDITGRLDDDNVRQAIGRLSESCSYLKVLGNYRAAIPEAVS